MLSYVPTILPQPPPERLQVGQLVGNGKVLKNQSSSINRKSDKPATLAFKVKNILTELTETEKVHYIFLIYIFAVGALMSMQAYVLHKYIVGGKCCDKTLLSNMTSVD